MKLILRQFMSRNQGALELIVEGMSIHVTKSGSIGIDCGGHVIVMLVEKWHALRSLRVALADVLAPVDHPLS